MCTQTCQTFTIGTILAQPRDKKMQIPTRLASHQPNLMEQIYSTIEKSGTSNDICTFVEKISSACVIVNEYMKTRTLHKWKRVDRESIFYLSHIERTGRKGGIIRGL